MVHFERPERSGDAGHRELEKIRQQLDLLDQTLSRFRKELCPEPEPPASEMPFCLEEKTVRRIIRARRIREEQLGAYLFADPAWDILLEALATELAQKRISVSGLCSASAVPATTALRWVKRLEQDGWLIRIADRFDARRDWMELTQEGSERIRRLLGAIWPNILPL